MVSGTSLGVVVKRAISAASAVTITMPVKILLRPEIPRRQNDAQGCTEMAECFRGRRKACGL